MTAKEYCTWYLELSSSVKTASLMETDGNSGGTCMSSLSSSKESDDLGNNHHNDKHV